MRKILLVAIIAISTGAQHAHSQMVVTDPGNLVAQAKNLLQELKSYGAELQQLQQTIQEVQWAATTAQSLIQNPNLGQVAGLLGQLGLANDLPINPSAVMGLVQGYGGINGLSSITSAMNSLNGLVNSSWNVDHLYTCTNGSFNCQQQQEMAAGTAGLKGSMGTLYQDLANHIQILQGLRDDAGSASDPAQREHILVEAALENSWAQNTGAQLQAQTSMFLAQKQANEDRENEHLTNQIDTWIQTVP